MFYKISNTQIASLLYAEGITLVGVDSGNSRRKEFIFKDDKRIEDLVKGFWQDTHKISPRKYMGAFKELKNRLYQ